MPPLIRRLHPLIPFPSNPPLAELQRICKGRRFVNLASNENPLGASQKAMEALRLSTAGIHRYPDGDGKELRERLANRYGVSQRCVVLGNGISELLLMATQAWLEHGDTALVPECSFPLYEFVVRLADSQALRIPLTRFRIDLQAARSRVDPSLRLVYLANPNNPTGLDFQRAELESFLQDLPERVLVLLDEAYLDYAEACDMPEPGYWVGQDANVLVLKTFSKVYGLAGLRIGYAVGPERWIQAFERVRMVYNTNQAALQAAVAALEDEGFRSRSIASNRTGRDFLARAAAEAGYSSLPSQANFILMEAGASGEALARRMLEKGVFIRGMHGFGFPECVRVSVGTDEENQIFAETLKSM